MNKRNNTKVEFQYGVDDTEEMTRLSLALKPYKPPPPPSPPPQAAPPPPPPSQRPRGAHRRGGGELRPGKREDVAAAYPWADTRRARVLRLSTLQSRGITEIRGMLQCKRCEARFEAAYELAAGFRALASRIAETKGEMNDRAPADWLYPTLPACRVCGAENSAQPAAADKKRAINWLFLLLSGLLGCCTLDQLKYFCKHTRNHRTGAKDRVLYLTYLSLCHQLEPCDLFNPHHR